MLWKSNVNFCVKCPSKITCEIRTPKLGSLRALQSLYHTHTHLVRITRANLLTEKERAVCLNIKKNTITKCRSSSSMVSSRSCRNCRHSYRRRQRWDCSIGWRMVVLQCRNCSLSLNRRSSSSSSSWRSQKRRSSSRRVQQRRRRCRCRWQSMTIAMAQLLRPHPAPHPVCRHQSRPTHSWASCCPSPVGSQRIRRRRASIRPMSLAIRVAFVAIIAATWRSSTVPASA